MLWHRRRAWQRRRRAAAHALPHLCHQPQQEGSKGWAGARAVCKQRVAAAAAGGVAPRGFCMSLQSIQYRHILLLPHLAGNRAQQLRLGGCAGPLLSVRRAHAQQQRQHAARQRVRAGRGAAAGVAAPNRVYQEGLRLRDRPQERGDRGRAGMQPQQQHAQHVACRHRAARLPAMLRDQPAQVGGAQRHEGRAAAGAAGDAPAAAARRRRHRERQQVRLQAGVACQEARQRCGGTCAGCQLTHAALPCQAGQQVAAKAALPRPGRVQQRAGQHRLPRRVARAVRLQQAAGGQLLRGACACHRRMQHRLQQRLRLAARGLHRQRRQLVLLQPAAADERRQAQQGLQGRAGRRCTRT